MIRVMHICNQLGAYRISSGIYVGRCMDATVARWPLVMPSNVMNVRGNTSDLQIQSASRSDSDLQALTVLHPK